MNRQRSCAGILNTAKIKIKLILKYFLEKQIPSARTENKAILNFR